MTAKPSLSFGSTPRVVLGVCGGVAAYKAVELCRLLMKAGAFVSPILTDNAQQFVGRATFAALASEPPRTSLWHSSEPSPHTHLGQSADLILVAPATARLVASYAHGLSDDLLATTLLATRAPVVLAPAMHTEMWQNPAVQANITLLRSRGVLIVDPVSGELAGGDIGVGRLAEPEAILEVALAALANGLDQSGDQTVASRSSWWSDRTVLVTAGGTKEPLDPVRYLGNRSSGKQGYAIAAEAHARGAKVILVTASDLPVPSGITAIEATTAQHMHDAVLEHLAQADVVIMAAAVADFRPSTAAAHKLKKHDGPPAVELEPTPDILAAVGQRRRPNQIIVGFAAETDDLEANARQKLERKNIDVIVANDVTSPSAGFGHDTNEALILDKNGRKLTTGLVGKRTVAARLLDHLELPDFHGSF